MTNGNSQEPENVHSATDPDKCREMEQKYGWKIKDIRPTKDSILEVDCVFYGEQTSFQDIWHDHQD